ncbi:MAG: flagellar motor switch protein FliM [Opitutales bacterium]|nr:flagellar motor switch protein FliM [Opitutales bacterium]
MGDDDADDILSQGGIDALLAQAESESEEAVYSWEGLRIDEKPNLYVEAYDFRNPIFLTEYELRHVRISHEDFIRYLSARLSMYLKMDVDIKMSQLTTTPYAQFVETIPNPTYINMFRVDPLDGIGIMATNPRLAMTIVDRMLGGKGHSVKDERYLTEIEMTMVDEIVLAVLGEWCAQWEDAPEMNAMLIGKETNGRFLQTSPHDAIMLVLTMEAMMGDCSEAMQLAIPYYAIETLIKRMEAKHKHSALAAASHSKEARWFDSFSKIGVKTTAEWTLEQVSVSDVVSLKIGDFIELPPGIIERTEVKMEGRHKYMGEIGIQNNHVAVELKEKIN